MTHSPSHAAAQLRATTALALHGCIANHAQAPFPHSSLPHASATHARALGLVLHTTTADHNRRLQAKRVRVKAPCCHAIRSSRQAGWDDATRALLLWGAAPTLPSQPPKDATNWATGRHPLRSNQYNETLLTVPCRVPVLQCLSSCFLRCPHRGKGGPEAPLSRALGLAYCNFTCLLTTRPL